MQTPKPLHLVSGVGLLGAALVLSYAWLHTCLSPTVPYGSEEPVVAEELLHVFAPTFGVFFWISVLGVWYALANRADLLHFAAGINLAWPLPTALS